MEQPWNITVKILRQKGMDGKPYYQSYSLQIHPDEYVLDAVEKIWAFQDRTLTFRHACHHATCGACGMRVNGVEKLTCITSIYSMTKNNGVLRIEPLRNFPVLSDLVVDMSDLYNHMEAAGFTQVASLETACLPFEKSTQTIPGQTFERLVDCIEGGMCISACPSSHTSSTYQGPAALAARLRPGEVRGRPPPGERQRVHAGPGARRRPSIWADVPSGIQGDPPENTG